MGKVYVVRGSSGEWSERSEWIVAAYLDHEMAKRHVILATEEVRAHSAMVSAAIRKHGPLPLPEGAYPKFEKFYSPFDGDEFWCSTVELLDKVPSKSGSEEVNAPPDARDPQ